jgi:hypothetical protein
VNLVEIFEKSKAFLEANAWGQTADRQEDSEAPDGFKYCAQGAMVYGAFGAVGYCTTNAHYHEGDCEPDEDGDCWRGPSGERDKSFKAAREFLDDLTQKISDRPYAGLTWYNDDLCRTKEDMIAVFDKAIEKAREGTA